MGSLPKDSFTKCFFFEEGGFGGGGGQFSHIKTLRRRTLKNNLVNIIFCAECSGRIGSLREFGHSEGKLVSHEVE